MLKGFELRKKKGINVRINNRDKGKRDETLRTVLGRLEEKEDGLRMRGKSVRR